MACFILKKYYKYIPIKTNPFIINYSPDQLYSNIGTNIFSPNEKSAFHPGLQNTKHCFDQSAQVNQLKL